MTINSQIRTAGPFAGTGALVAYPFSFKVFQTSDLLLTSTSATGTITTLVLSSDYTVTLNADQDVAPGGVINLIVALPVGATLVATSSVASTQPTSLTNGGGFFPKVIEAALDRLTILMQQLGIVGIVQALRVPEIGGVPALPSAANRANRVQAYDSSGNPVCIVGVNSGSAAALAIDLLNSASATKGAALVAYNASLAYAAGSVGAALRSRDVCVTDYPYLADATGAADSSAAFSAAWAAIKSAGGTIVIPRGSYLLNSQWLIDVDQTLPHNYEIIGYGAELKAGAAVTGHAIQVYKGYNNFGVKIEGLHFNHRNNTTVNGCIQAQGAANLRVVKCSMEAHNTKATYSGIELGPYTVGDGNTNSFWSLIDGFTTRQRSGGDGTLAAMGVRLKGVANATKIVNGSFGGVVDAIRFDTDGVAGGLANGCAILHNDFEGATNAITINTALPCTAMPTGLRVAFNRVESATTFFNITGALVTDPSYPVSLANNYCTVGNVTNYLVNPNSQLVFTDEPSYFGVGARNVVGGPADYKIVTEGVGKNLVLGNISNISNYSVAHIVLGAYHLWVESATGKLRIKGSAPTTDNDGTVVGTQV